MTTEIRRLDHSRTDAQTLSGSHALKSPLFYPHYYLSRNYCLDHWHQGPQKIPLMIVTILAIPPQSISRFEVFVPQSRTTSFFSAALLAQTAAQ
jgi:hypothetical protein